MPPIARIGLFRNLPAEMAAAAEQNLAIRLVPVIRQQNGFILGIWASDADHNNGLSFAMFRDAESGQASGIAINSAPLQPSQDPEMIPSPNEVYNCLVLGEIDHQGSPSVVRLAFTGVASASDDMDEDRRWLDEEFMPFLSEIPGLCQAYMLFDVQTRNRFSLTTWEDAPALEQSGAAVVSWSQKQAVAGKRPAFRPLEVLTYEIILHLVRGATLDAASARSTL